MRIRTGFNADEIALAAIEHDDKAFCSRPKAVLVDLQLIERDGDIVSFCSRWITKQNPPGRCA
jgi:hypothetical protein